MLERAKELRLQEKPQPMFQVTSTINEEFAAELSDNKLTESILTLH